MLLTRILHTLFVWKSSAKEDAESGLPMDLAAGPMGASGVRQSAPLHTLYIAVPSMIEHLGRREGIRETWAQSARQHRIPYHFYLGTSNSRKVNGVVKKESREHKDVIETPYEDLWNNKVRKLFDAMQRAVDGEHSSEYFMFVEDETFVRVPEVLEWLREHGTSKLYGGRVNYLNSPTREPTSIYYISPLALPDAHFPPYCESVGWVMGRETVIALLSQKDQRLMLHIDDVTVGCWLARLQREGKFVADVVNVGEAGIGRDGHLMVTGLSADGMRELYRDEQLSSHVQREI